MPNSGGVLERRSLALCRLRLQRQHETPTEPKPKLEYGIALTVSIVPNVDRSNIRQCERGHHGRSRSRPTNAVKSSSADTV